MSCPRLVNSVLLEHESRAAFGQEKKKNKMLGDEQEPTGKVKNIQSADSEAKGGEEEASDLQVKRLGIKQGPQTLSPVSQSLPFSGLLLTPGGRKSEFRHKKGKTSSEEKR